MILWLLLLGEELQKNRLKNSRSIPNSRFFFIFQLLLKIIPHSSFLIPIFIVILQSISTSY